MDDDEQLDLVDVNFDYYNVNAANDYHAIHRLLIQLLGPDAKRVQTGPLTELVVTVAEESGVGSTIKTEEEEGSDPYALLTVIGCDHAGVTPLIDYLVSKTGEGFPLASLLRGHHRVGLVLSERLINMPVQVMGPMYRMLSEEVPADAFTHYLFVSRVYRLPGEGEYCGFHPEDEVIVQHATHTATYAFTEDGGVGVEVAGRAMVVPVTRWRGLVEHLVRSVTE